MSLVEELYSGQDEDRLRRIWEHFVFLDPDIKFLQSDSTERAIRDEDKNYPLKAIKFNLFPKYSDQEASETFRLSMNRGIWTLNDLCFDYLDGGVASIFTTKQIPEPLDLFELVKKAAEDRKRFATGVDKDPQLMIGAYSIMRAIELGYRACIIDESSQVSNSLRSYKPVIETLESLLGFKNQRKTDVGGFTNEWDTDAGVSVLSSGEKPMGSRLKYLTRDDPPRTKYSSILIKTYSGLQTPDDIKDYIGVEIVVRNEEEKRQLVDYIRDRTSPAGVLENYKDTSIKPIGDASSPGFKVTKFILRVPCAIGQRNIPSDRLKSYGRWNDERGLTSYERVPVEVQIFTAEDYRRKDSIPEVSHVEYKRRQFMDVFPALFPRQIYEPVLRAA